MAPWVHFREWPEGRLLVYFTILHCKDAFAAMNYSVDDDSLSRRLRYDADENDESYIEVPLATQSVCVQFHFVDGTVSEARTFTVADLGIDR